MQSTRPLLLLSCGSNAQASRSRNRSLWALPTTSAAAVTSRWLQDHPENRPGVSYEASSAETLLKFFENLKNIISDYRIGASECWNKDECNIWLRYFRGDKLQALVARATQSQRPRLLDKSKGESTTALISTINAAGEPVRPGLSLRPSQTKRTGPKSMLMARFVLPSQRLAFPIQRLP